MSVNWNWSNKLGEIKYINDFDYNIKLNVYQGSNCLCVFCQEWKDKETKKDKYNFYGWFDDLDHAKKCLGLKKYQERNWDTGKIETKKENYWVKWYQVRLNTYYKESLKLAEIISQATFDKMRIELYYQAPKQDKKGK